MNVENIKAQMKKGVLEMCILGLISQKDSYPSDIINALKETELIVVEGTLYPLLSRLKNAGYLEYYWQESPAGPPRKYYKITDNGNMFLEAMNENWSLLANAVNKTNIKITTHE